MVARVHTNALPTGPCTKTFAGVVWCATLMIVGCDDVMFGLCAVLLSLKLFWCFFFVFFGEFGELEIRKRCPPPLKPDQVSCETMVTVDLAATLWSGLRAFPPSLQPEASSADRKPTRMSRETMVTVDLAATLWSGLRVLPSLLPETHARNPPSKSDLARCGMLTLNRFAALCRALFPWFPQQGGGACLAGP
jgi:hypothetical protein